MADYDWIKNCGCPLTGGHRPFCTSNPDYEINMIHAKNRSRGFLWTSAGAYQCKRGCGCLVWDIEAHIENVCKEFNPIVGNE